MNKKIKIYDLINRIHENKDVPKIIKYEDEKYQYKEDVQDYKKVSNYYTYLFETIIEEEKWLDVEVEILEDEEEIDIENIGELVGNVNVRMNNKTVDAEDLFYTISNIILSLNNSKDKTNQLVKAVKQLEKNKVDYIQPYKED